MKNTYYLFIGIGIMLITQSCSISFVKDPILDITTATINLGFGKGKNAEEIDSIRVFGKKEEIRKLLFKVNEAYVGTELASFTEKITELNMIHQYDEALQLLKEKLADENMKDRHNIYWGRYVYILFLKGDREQARHLADSLIATQDDVIRSLNGNLHFQLAQDASLSMDYESAKPHYEKSWYRQPLVNYLGKPADSLFARDISFLREKGVWNDGKPKLIYIWSPG